MLKLATRAALLFTCLGLIAPSACDKSESTATPADGAEAEAELTGTVLRYPTDGFELEVEMEAEQLSAGAMDGEVKMVAIGRVRGTKHDDKHLRLESWLVKLDSLEPKGDFKPKDYSFDEALAKVGEAKRHFSVTDLRGETDADMTLDLPENAEAKAERDKARAEAEKRKNQSEEERKKAEEERKKKEEEEQGKEGEDKEEEQRGPSLSDLLDQTSSFALPDTPKVGLELGKEIKLPTEESEEELFGSLQVPLETDYTYTMTSLEEVDGRELATVDILVEASGATELDMGGESGFFALATEVEATLIWDMQAQLPVSFEGYNATEIQFDGAGQSQTFEQSRDFKMKFRPAEGDAAPAEAAAPAADAEPASEEAAAEAENAG